MPETMVTCIDFFILSLTQDAASAFFQKIMLAMKDILTRVAHTFSFFSFFYHYIKVQPFVKISSVSNYSDTVQCLSRL